MTEQEFLKICESSVLNSEYSTDKELENGFKFLRSIKTLESLEENEKERKLQAAFEREERLKDRKAKEEAVAFEREERIQRRKDEHVENILKIVAPSVMMVAGIFIYTRVEEFSMIPKNIVALLPKPRFC